MLFFKERFLRNVVAQSFNEEAALQQTIKGLAEARPQEGRLSRGRTKRRKERHVGALEAGMQLALHPV